MISLQERFHALFGFITKNVCITPAEMENVRTAAKVVTSTSCNPAVRQRMADLGLAEPLTADESRFLQEMMDTRPRKPWDRQETQASTGNEGEPCDSPAPEDGAQQVLAASSHDAVKGSPADDGDSPAEESAIERHVRKQNQIIHEQSRVIRQLRTELGQRPVNPWRPKLRN